MPGIKRTEEYKRVKHLCLRFPLSTQWPDQVHEHGEQSLHGSILSRTRFG